MEHAEKEKLYKAMLSRDPRYDGRFYIGVSTTGIYCRPICPAKPKFENVEFYRSKAEAERAGFRPCLRCRPDLSPLSPMWKGTGAIIPRALRLLEEEDASGEGLSSVAERLGMSDRHLRRLFEEHVGASPIEVAISQRLHLARQLLTQTDLAVVDVGLAAGFQSLRRFNDAFLKTYKTSPREFRKERGDTAVHDDIVIDLPYSPPYDWEFLRSFFHRHLAIGVDRFEGDVYMRHFKTASGPNLYSVRPVPKENRLELRLQLASLGDLRDTVDRVRRQFDLGHNPHHIETALSKDPEHQTILEDIRLVRVPGAFDPFEVAITVILGQLVSTERARQNVNRIIELYGEKVKKPLHPELTRYFPTPAALAAADYEGMGVTRARSAAIKELARQVHGGEIVLSQAVDLEATRTKLLAIKGIGPWTVELIALRCLADTDAYPAKDLIVARAIEKFAFDEGYLRPWRAYLALAIWKSQAEVLTNKGKGRPRQPKPKKAGAKKAKKAAKPKAAKSKKKLQEKPKARRKST